MLSRVVKSCVLLLIGICIGSIAIIILDFYGMIKPTFWNFNFIDLLSLIAYTAIAIYVAYYLKNRFSDNQMKKTVFLGIANDIEEILEKELVNLESFMNKPEKEGEIKTLLTLKKINNKIHILEINVTSFSNEVKSIVDNVRKDYITIKRTITDDDFGTRNSFSKDNINEMLKASCTTILHLNQFKSSIFN